MDKNLENVLKKNNLFLGIDVETFPFENLNAEIMSIVEGKMLFKKGNPSDFIYLIQSGEINHFIDDPEGKTKIIVHMENDFIIAHDFETNNYFSSSAISMRDSFLVKIPRISVSNYITSNKVLLDNIKNSISERSGLDFTQPPMGYPAQEYKNKKAQDQNSDNKIEGSVDFDFSEARSQHNTIIEEPIVPSGIEEISNEDNSSEVAEISSDDISFEDLFDKPAQIVVEQEEESSIFNSDEIFAKVDQNEKFSVLKFSDVDIVTVNLNEATMLHAPDLKTLLLSMIKDGSKKILVELNQCEMIDSTFLGALVLSLKKINAVKGELRLVCGNKPAWMIFELTGMTKVFNTFPHIDKGMEGFYKT